MNLREYSAYSGINLSLLSRWINQGRIPCNKQGGNKGFEIDPQAADRAVAEMRQARAAAKAAKAEELRQTSEPKPREPRKPGKVKASAVSRVKPEPEPAPPPPPSSPSPALKPASAPSPSPLEPGPSFAAAQRAKMAYDAARSKTALEREQLQLQVLQGTLVYRSDMEQATRAVAAALNNQLEALPRQVRQQIPHLTVEEVQIIEGLVHQLRQAVADWKQPAAEEEP